MTLGFTMTFSPIAVAQTTNGMGVIGATRAPIGKMWDKSVMGIIEAPQFLKLPICQDTDTAVLEALRRGNPSYFPQTASEERERKEKEVLEEFHKRQRQYQAKHLNADKKQEQESVSSPQPQTPSAKWRRFPFVVGAVAVTGGALGLLVGHKMIAQAEQPQETAWKRRGKVAAVGGIGVLLATAVLIMGHYQLAMRRYRRDLQRQEAMREWISNWALAHPSRQ
jgi:hypothetical protein